MKWHRSEEEVDAMIEEMIGRTKGKYITQGVSFNKTCPRQLGLLKKALMSSVSFSGLVKEVLAINFDGRPVSQASKPEVVISETKDISNFI